VGAVKKVGIIGLGVIGQRLISEFKKYSKVEIEAVCDFNEELAKRTAEECGNIRFFKNYLEVLKIEEIDFVYVAVPPAVHYEVVMAAFTHNKHVLCEKPLANSEQEAEDMLHAANATGLVHAIHFPLAYGKAFATLNEMINEDQLGNIKRITLKMHFDQWPRPWQRTAWIGSRKQGGFIREITPHYLQMILHFFGQAAEVSSDVDYPDNKDLSETGVIAVIKLANGVKVLVDGLAGQAEKEDIAFAVHGSMASFKLENWRTVKVADQGKQWVAVNDEDLESAPFNLVDEFIKKLNNEKAFLVGFDKGLDVQRVLEKLIRQ
jgi:predicted dehydrogenase